MAFEKVGKNVDPFKNYISLLKTIYISFMLTSKFASSYNRYTHSGGKGKANDVIGAL